MKVFFSKEDSHSIMEKDVDAVDIANDKYVIRVRKSGVVIFKKENDGLTPIYDEHLDLTDLKEDIVKEK